MDESKNALKAVEYVADTVSKTKGVKITLFSVVPRFPPTFLETNKTIHPVFKGKVGDLTALTVQKKAAIEKAIKRAKKMLVDAGIAAKNITIKVEERKIGIARDILKEVKEGEYDTIAIGRRGMSATKAFLFGSISNKVVQFAKNRTVWVVD
ncbi:MAG TPA: universal stress protein [Syntrophaceae bacterium]|nr:universal stress protein [Syntrophaceae bacterium]